MGSVVLVPRGWVSTVVVFTCMPERSLAPRGRSARQNSGAVERRGWGNDGQRTQSFYGAEIALIRRKIPAPERIQNPLGKPKSRARCRNTVLEGKTRLVRGCTSRRVSGSVGFLGCGGSSGCSGSGLFLRGFGFWQAPAWFVHRVRVGGFAISLPGSGCFRRGLVFWGLLRSVRGSGVRVALGSGVWSLLRGSLSWALVFGGSAGSSSRGYFASLVVGFRFSGGGCCSRSCRCWGRRFCVGVYRAAEVRVAYVGEGLAWGWCVREGCGAGRLRGFREEDPTGEGLRGVAVLRRSAEVGRTGAFAGEFVERK